MAEDGANAPHTRLQIDWPTDDRHEQCTRAWANAASTQLAQDSEDADDARESKKAALKARRRASKATRPRGGEPVGARPFGARNGSRAAVFVSSSSGRSASAAASGRLRLAGGRGEIAWLAPPRGAVRARRAARGRRPQATVLNASRRGCRATGGTWRRRAEASASSASTVVESPFPPRDAANATLVAGCSIWVRLPRARPRRSSRKRCARERCGRSLLRLS